MNNRRKIIVALGASALTAPLGSYAQQQSKVRRIGLIATGAPSNTSPLRQALLLLLRDLGWVEGKNISIEHRSAEGRSDRYPDLLADLIRLKVDVIVVGGVESALAAQKATKVIPIVMVNVGDPVGIGLVDSLTQPGGNITGLSQMTAALAGKRLELLKEVTPKLSRVAVLWNPQSAALALTWKELELPARRLGVQLHSLEIRRPSDLDKAIEDATKAGDGALFIMADTITSTNLERLAGLAMRSRLPSIIQYPEFADAGGLMTYGPDRPDMYRRVVYYIDKILKGAKPADLPVEQPMKFELVVNMKTAKALGLTIPPSVLVQATRMIE